MLTSDLMTKPLDAQTFARHADACMGRTAASHMTPRPAPTHTRSARQLTFDVEGAYLKGEFSEGQVLYARPPPGLRHYVQYVAYLSFGA